MMQDILYSDLNQPSDQWWDLPDDIRYMPPEQAGAAPPDDDEAQQQHVLGTQRAPPPQADRPYPPAPRKDKTTFNLL